MNAFDELVRSACEANPGVSPRENELRTLRALALEALKIREPGPDGGASNNAICRALWPEADEA